MASYKDYETTTCAINKDKKEGEGLLSVLEQPVLSPFDAICGKKEKEKERRKKDRERKKRKKREGALINCSSYLIYPFII